MELALYCPVYGYYEKEEDTVGRGGDYCTSVSVGGLFGELLGCQFADWLADCRGAAATVQIVESGAHDGRLARDILTWLRAQRAELFSRLEYRIVEPSPRRREWQRRTLAEFGGAVHWTDDLGGLTDPRGGKVRGVIFANELLDALPVHRLGWDARERTWFEWGVAVRDGQFVWERMGADRGGEAEIQSIQLPAELLDVLPDGFTTEVCPAAETWWRNAAAALAGGKLMAIDYGLEAEDFFAPERREGTLRAYRRHGLSGDVLADPAMQDITAHVNFSALRAAGEAAGLRTEAFQTQAQFLTAIAAQIWNGQRAFGEWTAARTRQFQTLTHPEHFGRPFRALVQGRG